MAPEPDKEATAKAVKEAFKGRKSKFLSYHPEKDSWNAEDHHVRFIVVVISDSVLNGLWSESDSKKRTMEIAKAVYEVLSFLRATSFGAEPPRYEPSS
jgi:hypothetical protein